MKAKNKKIDSVEYEKRIRAVMEWVIDDWPYTDIITQITTKWGVQERQAKRYVADARDRWTVTEKEKLDKKRQIKIMGLKKLKRSLQERFKGTPNGINAVLNVEKEIIKLENLEPPKKIEADVKVTDLSKLPVTFE